MNMHKKQEKKQKKLEQKRVDEKALNWASTSRVLMSPSHKKGSMTDLTQANLKRRVSDFELNKDSKSSNDPKMWKYLEEFWKKITNKKDLRGDVTQNESELFWYIMWNSDFDAKRMSKDFDTFVEEFNSDKKTPFTEEHRMMSKWFFKVWTKYHKGVSLGFSEFCDGLVLATVGGTIDQRLSLLFHAMDVDNQGYLLQQNVIDYCSDILVGTRGLSFTKIRITVENMFTKMNRAGPLDGIDENEFISFADENPDCLFSIWAEILQYKIFFAENTQKHIIAIPALPPIPNSGILLPPPVPPPPSMSAISSFANSEAKRRALMRSRTYDGNDQGTPRAKASNFGREKNSRITKQVLSEDEEGTDKNTKEDDDDDEERNRLARRLSTDELPRPRRRKSSEETKSQKTIKASTTSAQSSNLNTDHMNTHPQVTSLPSIPPLGPGSQDDRIHAPRRSRPRDNADRLKEMHERAQSLATPQSAISNDEDDKDNPIQKISGDSKKNRRNGANNSPQKKDRKARSGGYSRTVKDKEDEVKKVSIDKSGNSSDTDVQENYKSNTQESEESE